MAGDRTELGLADKFGQVTRGVLMRMPVEAETLNAVLFVPLIGERIELALFRNRLVERGLKRADEQRVRQHRLELADGVQVRLVVRGRDEQIVAHGGKRLVVQLKHAVMSLGKHGLEADGADLGNVREDALLFVEQVPEEQRDAVLVARYREVILGDLLAGPHVAEGIDCLGRAADALHLAGGVDGLFGHLIELELQRGAADIANKNLHISVSCAENIFYTFYYITERVPLHTNLRKNKTPTFEGDIQAFPKGGR